MRVNSVSAQNMSHLDWTIATYFLTKRKTIEIKSQLGIWYISHFIRIFRFSDAVLEIIHTEWMRNLHYSRKLDDFRRQCWQNSGARLHPNCNYLDFDENFLHNAHIFFALMWYWKWCVRFHHFHRGNRVGGILVVLFLYASSYIITGSAHLIKSFSSDQHIEIVTLIPRFPLSANSCAMVVSKTKQSEFIMADETPSWIDLGVASHVNLRRWPFSSNLKLEIHVVKQKEGIGNLSREHLSNALIF